MRGPPSCASRPRADSDGRRLVTFLRGHVEEALALTEELTNRSKSSGRGVALCSVVSVCRLFDVERGERMTRQVLRS